MRIYPMQQQQVKRIKPVCLVITIYTVYCHILGKIVYSVELLALSL